MSASDPHVINLLAVDVITLERELDQRTTELIVAREMLSEALDIAYQALFHIYTTTKRAAQS